MPDTASLVLFMAATLALLIVPGPAVLYIVTRSIEQGRLAGLISTLGIALGAVVHVLFAAAGLSAMLMQSVVAFTVVKYFGAAYLLYLGIRTLTRKTEAAQIKEVEQVKLSRIFMQGFVVNLLNPKTAVFFFAFLPQFVNPVGYPVALQIIILGIIFIVMAIISDSLYAFIAGGARKYIVGNLKLARFQKNFAGAIYIMLGLMTAFSSSGKSK